MFFSTGQMLKSRTYQQDLLKKVEGVIFPQKFFPHSTASVENFWSAEFLGVRCMLLSCPAKKVTKECGIGEALRLCAPARRAALPYVPHPARTYDISGAP